MAAIMFGPHFIKWSIITAYGALCLGNYVIGIIMKSNNKGFIMS